MGCTDSKPAPGSADTRPAPPPPPSLSASSPRSPHHATATATAATPEFSVLSGGSKASPVSAPPRSNGSGDQAAQRCCARPTALTLQLQDVASAESEECDDDHDGCADSPPHGGGGVGGVASRFASLLFNRSPTAAGGGGGGALARNMSVPAFVRSHGATSLTAEALDEEGGLGGRRESIPVPDKDFMLQMYPSSSLSLGYTNSCGDDTTTATAPEDLSPTAAGGTLRTCASLRSPGGRRGRSLRREGGGGSSTSAAGWGAPEKLCNYTLVGPLGRGSFAMVHEYRHELTGVGVAVKMFQRKRHSNSGGEGRFDEGKHEARILWTMSRAGGEHPNVCNFVGAFESRHRYHLLVDLGGRPLEEILKDGAFAEARAAAHFRQLVEAVTFVHECGVAHRDIKPANIVVDDDGKLMLTDFGLGYICHGGAASCGEGDDEHCADTCGTLDFMAPEVLARRPYDPYKADVWSCGVTLFAMLTGRSPWYGASRQFRTQQIIDAAWTNSRNKAKLKKFSDLVVVLLHRLLHQRAAMRPSVVSLRDAEWLTAHDTTTTVL